jgi:hypothetical protein
MMEIPVHQDRVVILDEEISHRPFHVLDDFFVERTDPAVKFLVQPF